MRTIIFLVLLIPFMGLSQWEQIGQDIVGEVNSGIGGSVKLNAQGNVLAVGSFYETCKCVYIYENINDNWVQKGQTIYTAEDGISEISLNGAGDVLVFDTFSTDSNNLFIYNFNGSEWVTYGDFSNLSFELGTSGYYPIDVNNSGDIIAFGLGGSENPGKVYVIKNNNGVWEQLGQTINDYGVGSFVRLSADGQTLFTTAWNNSAKVYKLINGFWEQVGSEISGSGIEITAADISADGSTLLIKSTTFNKAILRYNENIDDWEETFDLFSPAPYGNLNYSGNIFNTGTKVYQNNNGEYIQLGEGIDMEETGGFMETSINDTGNIVAAGAELYNENRGLVRVFRYNGDLSIDAVNEPSTITIYPNPSKNIINFSETVKELTIYDLTGNRVSSHKDLLDQLNISYLVDGNYIIIGITKAGKRFTSKLIKKQD